MSSQGIANAVVFSFLLGFVVLLAVWTMRRFELASHSYANLALLQQDLERRTGLVARVARFRTWQWSLVWVHLDGKLASGRRAKVDFTRDRGARLRVAVDPTVTVSISRESLVTPLAKWLGVTTDVDSGDPAFDGRYVVAASSAESARLAYARGLKGAVDTVFAQEGVETLEVSRGWLEVNIHESLLEPESYAPLLSMLERVAYAFDRVPIVVRGLDVEVRALAGPGGTARCAYCHAGVSGEDPELVACERCHTVLHAGCWEELAHCPVLGCLGKEPRRARERA